MRKDSKDMVGASKEFSSSSFCSGSGLSLFSLPENSHRVRNVFYSHAPHIIRSLGSEFLSLPILYTTNMTFVKEKKKN